MTTLRWLSMPFQYKSNFFQQLNGWLGEVFYSTLPQAGYEIREEQIYTSFRIAKALANKSALLAEAGSGTGKTFAYLLPALCYAREKGSPVIIGCSSNTLQEQLISPQGDIAALSRWLGLEVSYALARDPGNYLCPVRAEALRPSLGGRGGLLRWLETTERGERSEFPGLDDGQWAQLSWEPSLDCAHCRRRGFCYVARERARLRQAEDFIICSHQLFFKDLWERRRQQEKIVRGFGVVEQGTPHLPRYCAVILDEGHLIEGAALGQLGVSISPALLERRVEILSRLPLASDSLLLALEDCTHQSGDFFHAANANLETPVAGQAALNLCPGVRGEAEALIKTLEGLQEELSLHTQADVSMYLKETDGIIAALEALVSGDPVVWWEQGTQALQVLPRRFAQALGQELMSQGKPVVITSATLDVGDEFAWFKGITGLNQAVVSQVATSFDLPKQMQLCLAGVGEEELPQIIQELVASNGGRSLLLCNTQQEQAVLQHHLASQKYLWEGEGERSWLVEALRRGDAACLGGTTFWEGIDVPGDALTMVIIPRLPFPPDDPLTQAKRAAVQAQGKDPWQQVDLPAMQIKLRQGIGRLIRSNTDYGTVVILDPLVQVLDNLASFLPQVPRVDLAELI